MVKLKQISELKPAKLKQIAIEATSEGFSRAIKTNITVVYSEGNELFERQPNGKKTRLKRLIRGKQNLTSKFKLK